MNNKRNIIFLSVIISLFQIKSVFADNISEGGDFQEFIGGLSGFLIGVGFAYVALRRAQVLSKYLGDEYAEVKKLIKDLYRKFRKPLFIIHAWVNIFATIFGAIHGYLQIGENKPVEVFGWIAVGSMTLLSISGIIIWKRYKPFWSFRSSKTLLRYVHRQWLFTIIMLIALGLHFAVAEFN